MYLILCLISLFWCRFVHPYFLNLDRGIGLKVNHYDTRKLNLQAEKLNKYLGLDGSGRLCLANESEDKVEKDRCKCYDWLPVTINVSWAKKIWRNIDVSVMIGYLAV